jgi:hypothetical protein
MPAAASAALSASAFTNERRLVMRFPSNNGCDTN